jgi:hypothetical protein
MTTQRQRKMKIKIEQRKPRNPLVEAVMRKAVRKHRNNKRDAKMQPVE